VIAVDAGAAALPPPPDPSQLLLLQDPKMRFTLELEFVEMLANPHYLHFLAQSRFLDDPVFINYLRYLQYFHRPEYLPFVTHPACLYFLDLLLLAPFRAALLNPAYITLMHDQAYWHWRSGRYNRFTEAEQRREAKQAQAAREREVAAHKTELQGELMLDAPADDKLKLQQ